MKITIIAIGRGKPNHEQALFQYYSKKILFPFKLIEVEERRALKGSILKASESKLLLEKVPKRSILIALDQRGEQKSSQEFAIQLQKWRDDAKHNIVFLIGGASGLDKNIFVDVAMILSLGKVTWPHMLVRGLLAEQIFRSQCILSGHPYHRQ